LEHGYAIWDFRGHEIIKLLQDRFKQFLWRPRPRTLLSKEQQKQVRRNLREYSRTFDEEDAAEESQASFELIAHRRRLVDEWNAWRSHCQSEADEQRRKDRIEQVGKPDEKEEVQELVDEVIDQFEEDDE
jgi:translation initiation factor 3 subunit B